MSETLEWEEELGAAAFGENLTVGGLDVSGVAVRRFACAGRPGACFRILEEGRLGAGDAVEVVRVPDHDVTMRLMMHSALVDKARLPELLAAPGLIDDWRAWIEQGAPE